MTHSTKPTKSFFAKYSLTVMAVCLFLLPFAAIGSIRAKSASKNDVRNWIPKEYEETIVYRDFRELFQGEEFVLVSWDSCNRSNNRIDDLALKLLPPLRVDYRGEALPDGHAMPDFDLAKLEIEVRLRDQRQADAAASGAEIATPKLHYGKWITRKDQEVLCVFENSTDEGDPNNPNREIAYATITREPIGYFKAIMTGPRAVRQIVARNTGFDDEAAAEGLAGALFAPALVLRKGAKLMVDDHPLPFNGAVVDLADGYVQVDEKNLMVKGAPIMAKGRTVWVDATPVHKFNAEGLPLDPATGAVLKPEDVCHVGLNLRQTCVVVTMSQKGLDNKKAAIDKLRTVAVEECSIPLAKLHFGGPPVDNVAIDEAGNKSLNMLAGVAILIGFIVSWYSLKSAKLVLIVLSAGIYSAILSLSIVWWTGAPVDAILFTMPSLVYVATTSGAIHLSNYYRDVRLEGHPAAGAGGAALLHAAVPLALATGTTAVGLATLCYTELIPIYYFGLYSAVGVLVSAMLLVFYIPAALELWQPAIEMPNANAEETETHTHAKDSGLWWNVGQWTLLNNKKVSFACLTIMAVAGYGLYYGETSVQLMRLLSPRERILTDYAYLESKLGPLVPMEIVIRLPKPADEENASLRFVDRLRLIREIQESVEKLPEVGGTMSTLSFMQNPDELATNLPARIQDSVRNKQLLKHREQLTAADFLRDYDDPVLGKLEIWRVSARVSALKNVDYAAFIENLKRHVEPIVADYVNGANAPQNAVAGVLPAWVDRRALRDDIHVQYTGVVPLVYKAQHSLMNGLVWGFFTDFALIVVVMIVVCRDWSAGMVLLFPSAFPAVVVFGGFGWVHHLLLTTGSGSLFIDIGYVMAPAVALGVTVDDVVHFMLWYKNGIVEGKTQKQAVELAFRGCARAMYQSWGVIGVGLSVFALSPFMPTRNFGIMMICMLTVALVGNLLMLPAMLAGPAGGVFAWGVRRKENRRRLKAGLPLLGEAEAVAETPLVVSVTEPVPARRWEEKPKPNAVPAIVAVRGETPARTHAAVEAIIVSPSVATGESIPEPHIRQDTLRRTFQK